MYNYEYFYQKLSRPLEKRQTIPTGVATPRLKTTGLSNLNNLCHSLTEGLCDRVINAFVRR